MFEALFKDVSTRFGLRIVENSIENPHFIFCSSFQNLRLGSIILLATLATIIMLPSCELDTESTDTSSTDTSSTYASSTYTSSWCHSAFSTDTSACYQSSTDISVISPFVKVVMHALQVSTQKLRDFETTEAHIGKTNTSQHVMFSL